MPANERAYRLIEAGLILVGVISLLSVVTLRHDVAGTAGADPASLITTAQTHLATYDWAFLLGQSLMPVFNAMCLGYVMYRSVRGFKPSAVAALTSTDRDSDLSRV